MTAKVLVVEDDPGLRETMVMSAQDHGGIEAHAKLRKPFDVDDVLRAISSVSAGARRS